MNQMVAYWDRGVANVPEMTGARHVLDAHDIVGLLDGFGVARPLGSVLDVGCGTGRAAQVCTNYVGADITPSAVEYCRQHGVAAHLIAGPSALPRGPFDWVLCLSVFTHVGEWTRACYLSAFAARAPQLLVDITPGDGGGGLSLWTAVPSEFEKALVKTGYDVVNVTELVSADGVTHRYYHARFPCRRSA